MHLADLELNDLRGPTSFGLHVDQLVTEALHNPQQAIEVVKLFRSIESDETRSFVKRTLLRRIQWEFEHPRLCYRPLKLKALCARALKLQHRELPAVKCDHQLDNREEWIETSRLPQELSEYVDANEDCAHFRVVTDRDLWHKSQRVRLKEEECALLAAYHQRRASLGRLFGTLLRERIIGHPVLFIVLRRILSSEQLSIYQEGIPAIHGIVYTAGFHRLELDASRFPAWRTKLDGYFERVKDLLGSNSCPDERLREMANELLRLRDEYYAGHSVRIVS